MDILNHPTDASLWAVLVGMGLPWVTALVQSQHWSSKVNAAVFLAACFVASAVTEWVRNGTSWHVYGYFHTFMVVILAAITLYKTVAKPSGHVDTLRAFGTHPKAVHPHVKKH